MGRLTSEPSADTVVSIAIRASLISSATLACWSSFVMRSSSGGAPAGLLTAAAGPP